MEPFIQVVPYKAPNGQTPFLDWLFGLDDWTRGRIDPYLDRLRFGHWGDSRPVGQGVSELRIHFGSGYRIYYIRDALTVVILLCAGDKGLQDRDIEKAHRYAAEYRSRK